MTTVFVSKAFVTEFSRRSCDELLFEILVINSPLAPWDVYEILDKGGANTTLGDIGISTTVADRNVRLQINREIRDPKGKDLYKRGKLSAKTKISWLRGDNCA